MPGDTNEVGWKLLSADGKYTTVGYSNEYSWTAPTLASSISVRTIQGAPSQGIEFYSGDGKPGRVGVDVWELKSAGGHN